MMLLITRFLFFFDGLSVTMYSPVSGATLGGSVGVLLLEMRCCEVLQGEQLEAEGI